MLIQGAQKNAILSCLDFTARFTPPHTGDMRERPHLENPYSAGSGEQPPAACVHRGTGTLYAQFHPSGSARSPAFISDRAGCP